MNAFSMTFKNFKTSIQFYGMQVMAMVFSIGMFYNFLTLKYGSDEFAMLTGSMAEFASVASLFLMVIFVAFFIWYSNSIFLRKRKKEFGMYCFMGITTSQLGRMYFFESFIQGIVSTVMGLGFGVISNRLFFMILGKMAVKGIQIPFAFSPKAAKFTLITFTIFYFIVSVKGYINIRRSKILDLFNAEKKEEKLVKEHKIVGIIGTALVLWSYYFIGGKVTMMSLAKAPVVVITVTIGTFLAFKEFIPMVLRKMQENKKICYKGINIVVIANLVYRIKKNYRSLAAVAILVASAVTASATCYSFVYFIESAEFRQSPHYGSIMIEKEDYKKIRKITKDVADKTGVKIVFESKGNVLVGENIELWNNYNITMSNQKPNIALTSISDANRIANETGRWQMKRAVGKVDLDEDELIRTLKFGVLLDGGLTEKIEYKDLKLVSNGSTSAPDYGDVLWRYPNTYLINDEKYNEVKDRFQELNVYSFDIDNEKHGMEFTALLKAKLLGYKEDIDVFTREDIDRDAGKELGILFFAGGMIAIVFIIASGVMVYFNIISEALGDKEKYERLMEVGVEKKDIWAIILKQGGIQCLLPLAVGIAHAAVAIHVLEGLMFVELIIPFTLSAGALVIVYLIFYYLSVRKFMSIVTKSEKVIK